MLREALEFIGDSSSGAWAQPIRAQIPLGVVIHAFYAETVSHLVTHLRRKGGRGEGKVNGKGERGIGEGKVNRRRVREVRFLL